MSYLVLNDDREYFHGKNQDDEEELDFAFSEPIGAYDTFDNALNGINAYLDYYHFKEFKHFKSKYNEDVAIKAVAWREDYDDYDVFHFLVRKIEG
ncbi:MAG: hypothetical protein Q4E22_06510 [Coriobacteriia bacterium]|nr:hypothetical protein [Coriobacteriia bacterium]